jgi:hypothetical protein
VILDTGFWIPDVSGSHLRRIPEYTASLHQKTEVGGQKTEFRFQISDKIALCFEPKAGPGQTKSSLQYQVSSIQHRRGKNDGLTYTQHEEIKIFTQRLDKP